MKRSMAMINDATIMIDVFDISKLTSSFPLGNRKLFKLKHKYNLILFLTERGHFIYICFLESMK